MLKWSNDHAGTYPPLRHFGRHLPSILISIGRSRSISSDELDGFHVDIGTLCVQWKERNRTVDDDHRYLPELTSVTRPTWQSDATADGFNC